MGRKICLVVGYGQSNEQGTAVNGATASVKLQSLYGWPLNPTSGRSSWVDVLASKLGSEGHAVLLKNRAIGGTGLLASWNGYVRTWQGSTPGFAPGSWCVPTTPNGYKYLAGGTPGVSQSTGASQPTWPTVAGQTVVDGSVTWTCYAAQPQDVNGYVCVQGDTGYDPRGFMAALVDAVVSAKAAGFEVWVMTSGHQSEQGNSIALVSGALARLMTRVLDAGADRVYLGVTNRNVGSPSSSEWDAGGWYHNLRAATFAALSPDSRVLLGGDLSAITLNSQTDPAGRIHLNDVGVIDAGLIWRAAISL